MLTATQSNNAAGCQVRTHTFCSHLQSSLKQYTTVDCFSATWLISSVYC